MLAVKKCTFLNCIMMYRFTNKLLKHEAHRLFSIQVYNKFRRFK